MIKPTIGRVVWYKNETISDQFMPALISYVHNDGLVNLAAFDKGGFSMPRAKIVLYQGDAATCPEDQCCWMPYQKQQAEKADPALVPSLPLQA